MTTLIIMTLNAECCYVECILSVANKPKYGEYHYDEYRYAECRGAVTLGKMTLSVKTFCLKTLTIVVTNRIQQKKLALCIILEVL